MSYHNDINKFRTTIPYQAYIAPIGINQNRIVRNTINNLQPQTYLEVKHPMEHINQKMRSTRGSSYGLSCERQTQQSASLNFQMHIRQDNPPQNGSNTTRIKPNDSIKYQTYTERQTKLKQTEHAKYQQPEQQKQITKKQEPQVKQNINMILNKNFFDVLCPVGKGGFGKVWKVCFKKTKEIFAMKQMYKAKIINKKSINSVMNERTLLAKVRHPFLINMSFAFQDRENLYLIMDYINGGDLRYHMGHRRNFNEKEVKFFIANIVVGLEYLHSNKIIHRDIKPQNLVMGSDGYIRITDLGISRELRPDNYQDTSGTPGYMAPEVICRRNHSFQADFFALGVIGYEIIVGRRPYTGKNRKEIRQAILAKQANIKLEQLSSYWSLESIDFINKLLVRNPTNRLGCNGVEELKSHPWLRDINWSKLVKKQIEPPFIPLTIQEDYQEYKKQISEDTVQDDIEENLLMLRDGNVQSLFDGYGYNGRQVVTRFKRTGSTTDSDNINKYDLRRGSNC